MDDEDRMARRVLRSELRSRGRIGWMNCGKVALDSRGMTAEVAVIAQIYKTEWRTLVHWCMCR